MTQKTWPVKQNDGFGTGIRDLTWQQTRGRLSPTPWDLSPWSLKRQGHVRPGLAQAAVHKSPVGTQFASLQSADSEGDRSQPVF